jgi:hypothetical protein
LKRNKLAAGRAKDLADIALIDEMKNATRRAPAKKARGKRKTRS